jgi:SecD/SecF fusion protein
MNPVWTFSAGLLLLILFGWYFATDLSRRKRWLGTILTLAVTALSIASIYPPQERIRRGLDLEGGTSFLLRLVPKPDEEGNVRAITPAMLDQAVEVIRARVDRLGGSEPVIAPAAETGRILVQIPGLDTAKIAEAREQLAKVARLEFRLVHPENDRIIAQINAGEPVVIPPGYRIETIREKGRDPKAPPREEKIVVKTRADLSGERIAGAMATFDQQGWGVRLRFDKPGAELFGKLSAAHVNERFAIVLDEQVQSAPVIREPMYEGNASITGSFTEEEARTLASVLENPLQTPVKIEEQRSVSASLGADSVKSGVFSGFLGLALTLLSVLIYYRFAGLVANIALIINIAVLLGAMSMFGFVLTLPGIAGIILTIGMAIDANVLIYERLREELAAGKSLKAAVDSAYDKAFSAIFDSNVTTLITAGILFWKATGPVKGFAVTLTIGILASMFTALLVTRNCFGWAVETGLIKRLSMANLIKPTKFDFLGARRIAIGASTAVILILGVIFAMRGERNFGVDFRGGDLLYLQPKQKVAEGPVREALKEIGLAESVVQTERTGDSELLTIRSPENTAQRIQEHLQTKFPDAQFESKGMESVGSLVGNELARNSAIALFLGLLGILIYVTIRFEFSFAMGALVALLHDVLITIGAFALFGREMSLIIVGAVLTIAGYSINDTIVVFDRIREGIRAGQKGSIKDIMNSSINDTLSRTVLTGGTTLLTTAALYLFGGPVLRDFAFAILVGVVVGTYSSIFVASPIVLWFTRWKGRTLHAEVRDSQQQQVGVRGAA